jgi:phytoene dehydrogenase-like protein
MICIVGAGLTGLALARELAGRGVEHVVLEAADRPGGVIRSGTVDGRVLDFGPQRFRMSAPLAASSPTLGWTGSSSARPRAFRCSSTQRAPCARSRSRCARSPPATSCRGAASSASRWSP